MTLAEIRAEMTAKAVAIRAKLAELNGAPTNKVVEIEAAHDALVGEYDALANREKMLADQEAREAPARPGYGAAGRVPGAERQQRREAMTVAIMNRASPSQNELTSQAREYRGMTLVEMARDCLEAEGLFERGMARPEVAQRSLMASSDFPNILADVSNKTLRQSYDASPRTFQPIANRHDLKDFKQARSVQLGAAPQLLPILEDGEYKRGSMIESSETMQLASYGRVVGITRRVILNDDVGAFTDLPRRFGQSAANLESDIVWGMILSNPLLKTDNTAVFAAGHHNLVAPNAGGVPSVAGLAAARTSMAKQLDPDGLTVLNLRPKYIVIPTELEVPVAQLLYPIQPNATAAAVPESIRSLIPISEPRLSSGASGQAGSPTAWYLFADPADAEVISYSYLDGQDGPYTETRNGFDIDGVEVKCRHDFGASAVDFRGAYRNAGL